MNASTPETPTSSPILGRDDKGRFIRGNPGGPGNPFARKTAALRSALLRKLDEERMERLADMLLERAISGDVSAARLVLQYAIGKPTSAIDPDDVDRLEWEHVSQQVVPMEEVTTARSGMPVALASMTCQVIQACQAATVADELGHKLAALDTPPAPEPAPAPAMPVKPEKQAEIAEPSILPLPSADRKREKTDRRCANPRQSMPPHRQQTEKSPEDLSADDPHRNGKMKPREEDDRL